MSSRLHESFIVYINSVFKIIGPPHIQVIVYFAFKYVSIEHFLILDNAVKGVSNFTPPATPEQAQACDGGRAIFDTNGQRMI